MSDYNIEQLLQAIVNSATANGLSHEQLLQIIESRTFDAIFNQRAIIDGDTISKAVGVYAPYCLEFIVNYGLNVKSLVVANKFHSTSHRNGFWCGNGWSIEIPEHLREGATRLEGEIFKPSKTDSLDELIERISKAGYRQASAAELLAFGAAHPREVLSSGKGFGVAALGSTVRARSHYGDKKTEEGKYLALVAHDISTSCGSKDYRRDLGISSISDGGNLSYYSVLGVKEI